MIIKILRSSDLKEYHWYNHLVGHTVNAEWEIKNGFLTGCILVDGKKVLKVDTIRMPDNTEITYHGKANKKTNRTQVNNR